ncbi:MAG: alpha/beta hydrolase, partial [Clostridia bacterium]|nr:alpha/beta hydrolase [Clostridia bacterium]
GFSEIRSVLRGSLKKMYISGKMLRLSALWARLRCGCGYEHMRPIDSLKASTVPILFIHGEQDSFIFPVHSLQLQKAAHGYSEVHLIPGAGHAASVLTDPETYCHIVRCFLTHIPENHP